jgi:hypothetical protein
MQQVATKVLCSMARVLSSRASIAWLLAPAAFTLTNLNQLHQKPTSCCTSAKPELGWTQIIKVIIQNQNNIKLSRLK